MRILAIEPYYGGSHKAFLDSWIKYSRFDWQVLSLPPRKWKWRMRGSAMYFAEQVKELAKKGQSWDVIFCSDMLNVAEFLGLLGRNITKAPVVVYFHENQITYPYQFESERDFQFGMTNITSALAADQVWFNSNFHFEEFIEGAEAVLKKMPDYKCLESVNAIREKHLIQHLATEIVGLGDDVSGVQGNGKLKIVWAARWEHDKNPEDFFKAVYQLKEEKVDFEVSVLGESFRSSPSCFDEAKEQLEDKIHYWGFQPSFADYCKVLAWGDVFVSTAIHEFFGLAAVEAALMGAFPVLPERLAYPEVFGVDDVEIKSEHFYDGSVDSLVVKLKELAARKSAGSCWRNTKEEIQSRMVKYLWQNAVKRFDAALEQAV